jgi:hypothetical protein
MEERSVGTALVGRLALGLLLLTACSMLPSPGQARGAIGRSGSQTGLLGAAGGAGGIASATLEQCVTAVDQAERSATFSGEMIAIGATARMTMRIEVQERMPEESLFHTVSAPGLGVWRGSEPKVKLYEYVKQVTNLSSPAFYRAIVQFRWLNGRGHVIRRAERLTPRCAQPATPGASSPPGAETPPATVSPPPAVA